MFEFIPSDFRGKGLFVSSEKKGQIENVENIDLFLTNESTAVHGGIRF